MKQSVTGSTPVANNKPCISTDFFFSKVACHLLRARRKAELAAVTKVVTVLESISRKVPEAGCKPVAPRG